MSYYAEVLADSPILYWKLDETSGTTAADSSGNGRNATHTNGPVVNQASLLTDGSSSGRSVAYDGSNDYTTIAAAAWMETPSFTVECLARLDATATSRAFVFRDSAQAATTNRHWMMRAAGTSFRVGYWDTVVASGTGDRVTGTTLAINTTYHLVMTFDDATKALRAYVDGVECPNSPWTYTGAFKGAVTQPIEIGRFFNPGGGQNGWYLDGFVDEVAVYDTALSGARIASHYAAGRGPKPGHRHPVNNVRSPALAGGDPDVETLSNAIERIALVSALGTGTTPGTEVAGGSYARLAPTWDVVGAQAIGTADDIEPMPTTEVRGWEGWDAAGTALVSRGLFDPLGYGLAVAATDRIEYAPHRYSNTSVLGAQVDGLFVNGTPIVFQEGYTPAGLTAHAKYYVINADDEGFQVSTSLGGSAAGISSDTTSDGLAVWGTVRVLAAGDAMGPFVFQINRRTDEYVVGLLRPVLA